MSCVHILAPAKLNLGLAVLGKRNDGYHEIDTIMAMIDLYDEIVICPKAESGIEIVGMEKLGSEENIIYHAAAGWCRTTGIPLAYRIQVCKRIPSPGGLGGGSSDAAATLRALNALHGDPLNHEEMHGIATQLGADCPFFLGEPTARATGTGTDLVPINSAHNAVVIIVPSVSIEAKTAKLYGSLCSTDFGSTTEIDVIEGTLRKDRLLAGSALPNSFNRPVRELMFEVGALRESLLEHGIETSMTGAGPGLYSLTTSVDEALRLHTIIRDTVTADTFTCVASFLERTPQPELLT